MNHVTKQIFTLICILTLCLAAFSCSTKDDAAAGQGKANMLRYARQLKMWRQDGATFAEVYADDDTTKRLGLYIFPETGDGAALKADYPGAVVITPGTDNMMLFTSVHSSALEELGAAGKIGSLADASYFSSPYLKAGLADGRIADMGSSQQLSKEKLIALKPSVAIVSVFDGMDVSALIQQDIPIIYMADNLEATPLGRAEWIKFLSMIAGRRSVGDSIFNSVEKSYVNLCDIVKGCADNPKVMVENMYQGTWYVPGGGSYAALLIADAGGDYAWSDNTDNGSLSLSVEQVLDRAADADIWLLKLYGEELTADGLRSKDGRNMLFAPVEKHGVWYSNTAVSRLFDEFPYHPDRLLKDYIAIFHPDKLPDYTPVYFKRMGY